MTDSGETGPVTERDDVDLLRRACVCGHPSGEHPYPYRVCQAEGCWCPLWKPAGDPEGAEDATLAFLFHEHCDWPRCACWCRQGEGTRPHPVEGHHCWWGGSDGSGDGYPPYTNREASDA